MNDQLREALTDLIGAEALDQACAVSGGHLDMLKGHLEMLANHYGRCARLLDQFAAMRDYDPETRGRYLNGAFAYRQLSVRHKAARDEVDRCIATERHVA